MSRALSVDLNRDRLHDIAVTEAYTTDETFLIELVNHGEAVHIHIHLDDTLSQVARLETGNHYVAKNRSQTVPIEIDAPSAPVTGKLKIVTGYGAETAYVDVTVEPFVEEESTVQIDEELGKPNREPQDQPPSFEEQLARWVSQSGTLPVVAVGGIAILLALAIGLIVDSAIVFIGVGVVIGGVLAAVMLQMR